MDPPCADRGIAPQEMQPGRNRKLVLHFIDRAGLSGPSKPF